jgi:hypothetical protein
MRGGTGTEPSLGSGGHQPRPEETVQMFTRRKQQAARTETNLPVNTGPGQCDKCWVMLGVQHELSCDEVTPEQFRAYLGIPDRTTN